MALKNREKILASSPVSRHVSFHTDTTLHMFHTRNFISVGIEYLFSWLSDKRRPDALSALRRTPRLWKGKE